MKATQRLCATMAISTIPLPDNNEDMSNLYSLCFCQMLNNLIDVLSSNNIQTSRVLEIFYDCHAVTLKIRKRNPYSIKSINIFIKKSLLHNKKCKIIQLKKNCNPSSGIERDVT